MNFKKHISLFLAFFLLVSNSGMAFNVHFCGDEIASVSLKTDYKSKESEKNCCGINEEKSHCCKDKVIHFEKKSDNTILKAFSLNAVSAFIFEEWRPIVFSSNQCFKNSRPASYFCDAHAPPLFKQYHRYIFYA
jgi:hypothetical protein